MRIVSDNSDQTVVLRQTKDAIHEQLRALTANLLRVSRGAGKPLRIERDIEELHNAFARYEEVAGPHPVPDLHKALDYNPDRSFIAKLDGENRAWEYAVDLILSGAMQVVASRLVGQATQQAAGSHTMYMGIRELDEIKAARRYKEAAADKAARPIRKRKRIPAQRKPKKTPPTRGL